MGSSGPPTPGSCVLLHCSRWTPAAWADLSVPPLSYLGLQGSPSILTCGPVHMAPCTPRTRDRVITRDYNHSSFQITNNSLGEYYRLERKLEMWGLRCSKESVLKAAQTTDKLRLVWSWRIEQGRRCRRGQKKGCAGCRNGPEAHLRGARAEPSTSRVHGFAAAAASAATWWVASCSRLQQRKHRLGELP